MIIEKRENVLRGVIISARHMNLPKMGVWKGLVIYLMKRWENLGNLIGRSSEWVKENIDDGMIDILIELNKKGYKTIGCCEGHGENWHGYIYFAYHYKFIIYPQNFTKFSRKRCCYEWNGRGEESRKEFLKGLLKWAEILPYKAPIEKKCYTLMGRSKTRSNSSEKALINTYDIEDIKAILNRADMCKYDLRIVENIIERY